MKRNRYSSNEEALRRLLRDRRVQLGIRQEDLADKLEVPQSFISKYESGERLLTFGEAIQICQALNWEPAKLLKEYLSAHET